LTLVGIAANNYSTARTISSVTFTPSGGSATALSSVGSVQNGNGRLAAIYSLLAPPSGTSGTMVVNFSGSVGYGIVAGAANFKGVDQAVPLDNFASTTSTTTTVSLSVPSSEGDLVFDTVFLGAQTLPTVNAGAAQSPLWNSSASRTLGAVSTKAASSSTTTMSWTATAASNWAVGGVSINPSGGGAPTGVTASDGTYTDKVQVSWTASTGATSYQVYRNTSSSSSGATQIGTPSTSPYDDTTATPGATYYYFVKACNGAVCSNFSASDSGYCAMTPSFDGGSDAGPADAGAPDAGATPDAQATPVFVAAGGGRGPLSTTIVTDHTFVDTVPKVNNQTMRVMLRTTAGGSQVAVKLTNRFSSVALPVGAAHVAIQSTGSTIVPGSDRTLTFNGAGAVTIPAHAEVWSDPAGLAVSRGQTLAISVHVTGNLTPPTESGRGNLSWMTHYLSRTGNHTSDLTMSGATTTHIILFVAEVRVLPATPAATLVTLGDSITEGACSSAPNGDWPDLLSDRLPTLPDGTAVSVFNAGIGSGRFESSDGAGLRGILRLPELLALPKVRWVTILMGVNDISYEHATAAELISAYQSAITQAHAAGVRVIGIPILPFRHSTKDVGANWATAQSVNSWIRTPGNGFDAMIDFEPVVGDPADPGSMKASLTCDHVHPNQAGYTAMANAIDLSIFH
jgi:lysophospholipase L1-like esterase